MLELFVVKRWMWRFIKRPCPVLSCPTKLAGLHRTVSTFRPCSSKFTRLIWPKWSSKRKFLNSGVQIIKYNSVKCYPNSPYFYNGPIFVYKCVFTFLYFLLQTRIDRSYKFYAYTTLTLFHNLYVSDMGHFCILYLFQLFARSVSSSG